MDTLIEKIAWRRRGVGNDFVGSLRAGADGIRLTGRDTLTGLDVALSIPPNEVEHVHVQPAEGDPGIGDHVIVDLAAAGPIILRRVGDGPFHAQLLARELEALLQSTRLLVQGRLR